MLNVFNKLVLPFKKKHQAEEYFSEAPSTDYLLINIYKIREKKKEMTSRSKVKQMKSCEKADARVAVFFL